MRERLGILISGGGTTMSEIIKASQFGQIPLDIGCVISSNPNAGGVEKAKELGLSDEEILIVDPNDFRGDDKKIDQEGFGLHLREKLRDHGVTVVTQNGWMPLTPEVLIDEYQDSIFNQHPGPVPEFGGKGMFGRRVHAARIVFSRMVNRDYWTEVIAQRVDKDFDAGKVVGSLRIPIFPSDSVDTLQERALPIEHALQIRLLDNFVQGKITEVTHRQPLVQPGEEHILFLAKEVAKTLYPKG